jgi:hypothetical protein
VMDIHNSKELVSLSEESIYTQFKNNFRVNLHSELNEFALGYLKESLMNIYKNFEYKTNTKESYTVNFDFMHNTVGSDVCYRMLREVIYFIHFTSKNFIRRLKLGFKFKNCCVVYKGDSLSESDESFYKFSLILLSDFHLGFVKDFSLKFQFEIFLYYNKNEVKLKEIIKEMINTLGENELYLKYKAVIFPPIEFTDEEDLEFLLSKISGLNFVEIPMKIVQSNFQNLKNFIKSLQTHPTIIENFCLTLMFYNLKNDNVANITEMILTMLQDFISSFFGEEGTNKVFFLKMFFVIYENNSVEYRYYIFKEKSAMGKRGGLRSSQSNLFASASNLKITVTKCPAFSNEVMIIGKKFSKDKCDKRKILTLINGFLIENSSFSNTRESSFGNLKKTFLTSSQNINVNSSNSSFESVRSSKSGLTGANYQYLFESQKRKFIIEDRDNVDNLNLDYNEKFIEFYKIS